MSKYQALKVGDILDSTRGYPPMYLKVTKDVVYYAEVYGKKAPRHLVVARTVPQKTGYRVEEVVYSGPEDPDLNYPQEIVLHMRIEDVPACLGRGKATEKLALARLAEG